MSREACPPHRRHLFVVRENGVVVLRLDNCQRCGKPRSAANPLKSVRTETADGVERNRPLREVR